MFKESKYTNWYYNIITKAQQSNRTKYTGDYYESHHIIPKSISGGNDKSNLVLLTAKEHYICHLLLPKMCVDSKHKSKMVYAHMRLSESACPNRYQQKHNSNLYHKFKESYIPLISGSNSYMYGVPKDAEYRAKISKTRIDRGLSVGEKNPMFGKSHTEESKQIMSQVKKERIQEKGVEIHQHQSILANPRSKSVQTCDGRIFPSLSAAKRAYGFGGISMAQVRIRRGDWKYVE